ncbi:MAG: DNA polymerase III subunit delta' [Nitrospirae bacterium]|nr:MAG: DNA polymerase III subunit delta' [Nitrospirota bacterium]
MPDTQATDMPFTDIIGHTTPIHWLQRAITTHQIGHAYLFVGDPAIGKRSTAIRFIQALSCEQTVPYGVPDSCGTCRACRHILAEIHPDYLCIRPEHGQSATPQIKIEQIREIEHHVIYRPLSGARKACLIDDADRMTSSAANALLKTLEEPPDHSLFVLVTSRPTALPATIHSRCFRINFSPPPRHTVERYLIDHRHFSRDDARCISLLTGSRLGEAVQVDLHDLRTKVESFFAFLTTSASPSIPAILDQAEHLARSYHAQEIIQWLWHGFRDLLILSTGAKSVAVLPQAWLPQLDRLAQCLSTDRILVLLDLVHELEQGLQRNTNIQLGLERLFLALHEMLHEPASDSRTSTYVPSFITSESAYD